MTAQSINLPHRDWTAVETYVYGPTAEIPDTGEVIDVAPRGATYRLDESGLYVQIRSEAATSYALSKDGNVNLNQMRRTHSGYIFDTHDLQVDVGFEDLASGARVLSVKVVGWLSKMSMFGDLGEDEIEYNDGYLQDRETQTPVTYTWEEWQDLHRIDSEPGRGQA